MSPLSKESTVWLENSANPRFTTSVRRRGLLRGWASRKLTKHLRCLFMAESTQGLDDSKRFTTVISKSCVRGNIKTALPEQAGLIHVLDYPLVVY